MLKLRNPIVLCAVVFLSGVWGSIARGEFVIQADGVADETDAPVVEEDSDERCEFRCVPQDPVPGQRRPVRPPWCQGKIERRTPGNDNESCQKYAARYCSGCKAVDVRDVGPDCDPSDPDNADKFLCKVNCRDGSSRQRCFDGGLIRPPSRECRDFANEACVGRGGRKDYFLAPCHGIRSEPEPAPGSQSPLTPDPRLEISSP